MGWYVFDEGRSIGSLGSEDGVIILDEENDAGARVTLERSGTTAPFAITCGIYGFMAHTHFLETEIEARAAFQEIKTELTRYIEHPMVKKLALSARLVDFPIAADTFRMLGRNGDQKRRQSFILPYSQDATGTSRTRSS